ncbi:MAG: Ppx/GppA phosphatase family protein [Planctomycetota bacterium]
MTTHEDLAPQSLGSSQPASGRLGVVDVGSNALRTMIGEVAPGERGSVRVVEAHREPVRLGRDVFLSGRIPEAKIGAVVEVMTRFAARCRELGVARIAAIATSAVRDARNQEELLARVREATGIGIDVISGSQEAYLLTAAVRSRVDIRSGRSILVDLGGGSVEVSLVESGEIVHSESYRLGALRVLHALEGTAATTPAKDFVELVDRYVRSVEDRIRDHFGGRNFDRYVATGGNIDSIADLLQREGRTRKIDSVEVCRLDDIRDLTARLADLGFEERCTRFELRPDRADTILQAAVVYYRLGRVAQVEEVLVPRVGMRDGLLQELVAETVRHSKHEEHRDSLLSTCRELGRRYHVDAQHAERVRRHAVTLFDATRTLHDGAPKDRSLLEAASLLHDIGVFVNNSGHHKHTWYLVRESDIPGIDSREREIVAQIARYHRRAHPSRRHTAFDALAPGDRERVRRLSALLRIADVLDRSHMGRIEAIEVALDERSLRIVPRLVGGPDQDISLERLGVPEKATLFTEVFDRRVVLEESGR